MKDFDPTDIAAIEAIREEARKAQLAEAVQFADDFKWLMRDRRGRRLVFWLLSVAGVFRSTYVQPKEAAAFMPIAMAHAEGTKEIGYRLLAVVNKVCPELYAKMMKENSNA